MAKTIKQRHEGIDGVITLEYSDGSVTTMSEISNLNEVGASRNLTLSDSGSVLKSTPASPVVLTIPNDATIGTGDIIVGVYQAGTGAASFAAGAGVTLRNTAPTPAQYKTHGVMRVGANEWAYIV